MSLLRKKNFQRQWTAQGLSLLGSQVTLIALPLLALRYFHASAFQMGLLTAAGYLPFLVFGLPAGVWVDRFDLKWVLVVCDFARLALFGSIPLFYSLGYLTLPFLYWVAFASGFFTLLFDVGNHSFLPRIVDNDAELIEGNTKLYLTFSLSNCVGPAIGGAIVQALSAPMAILVDCLSYLFSGGLLMGVSPKPKPETAATESRPTLIEEMRAGLGFVFGSEYLRPIVLTMAIGNFFDLYGMVQAVIVIFITQVLGMSAFQLGLCLAISNVGAIAGTLVNDRLLARHGLGKIITFTSFIPGLAVMLLPAVKATPGSFGGVFAVGIPLGVAQFAISLFNVNQLSLRQHLTPVEFLGRMNATFRFLIWGTIPLGAFVGGVLCQNIGARPTLFIAGCGSVLAAVPIWFSKVAALRTLPAKAACEAVR